MGNDVKTQDDQFDDQELRNALRRTSVTEGASPLLKRNIASMLAASAPVMVAASKPLAIKAGGGRVFGLPRAWGMAAALAMLLTGGALITYELLPEDRGPLVTQADMMKQTIAALIQVHQGPTASAKAFATDLMAFQNALPTLMPVATLPAESAHFISARVDQVQNRLCYALKYEIQGKPYTLVTAAVGAYGYEVPNYNEVSGGVRLAGGNRDGWLVCLMGDTGLDEAKYKSLLDQTKFLASPSTQPVSTSCQSGGVAVTP